MFPNRRTFNTGLLATAFACLQSTSWAQQLKSLKITAPANPGGGYDQLARAIQDALTTEKLATGVQALTLRAGRRVASATTIHSPPSFLHASIWHLM